MNKDIKITKSTTRDELLDIIEQIIWEDPCIDSYTILSKLISFGYEMKSKENFLELLRDKRLLGKLVPSGKDMYIVCRELPVTAILSEIRHRNSCYDCLFLRHLADNYKINKIAYDSEADKHEQVFCALNNTLKIMLQMNNIHERCPINLAIEASNSDSKD